MRLRRRTRRAWAPAPAAALAALALTVPATPSAFAAERAEYPVDYSLARNALRDPVQALRPDAAPPGANDWSCRPSKEHPQPVVLAHAMGVNQRLNWSAIAPLLANEGYCVYSLTYGNHDWLPSLGGLRSMREGAAEVGEFVERVRARTGAAKVDLVGHSEGTTTSAYYIKKLGGADKVDQLVGIAPNYGGTELYGLTRLAHAAPYPLSALLDSACAPCREYATGSAFIEELNSGGTAAVPGVRYTNIQGDEKVVVPDRNGRLEGPNARNLRVGDGCARDLGDHVSIAGSPRAAHMVLAALDPGRDEPLPCTFVPPGLT